MLKCMKRVTPRRPSGFTEYLPGEQIEFNRLIDIVRRTYERYGASPIDTPDIELSEVLLAKGGGETEQQVYRFKREGSDTDLTLRYDLTVPLARYVAEHQNDLAFPFWRYHIGKVHRAERAQAGRFREFYQCDIDVIGSKSTSVDAQFPAIINDILEQFGFGEFVIRINNRLLFDGLFAAMGISHLSAEILHAIDRIEKVSHQDFVKELRSHHLTDTQVDHLVTFVSLSGSNDEVIEHLSALGITTDAYSDGVTQLRRLVESLRAMNIPEHRFKIDTKIVRGLDYYTGTVYETILTDFPQIGSIFSGGRYDNLVGYYSSAELSGIGISIGLSRLFYALRELGAVHSSQQTPAQVLVMPLNNEQLAYATAVTSELRQAGISTILNSEPGALPKRLKYADKLGVPYVAIIGAEEASSQTLMIKDLAQRADESLSISQVISKLTR